MPSGIMAVTWAKKAVCNKKTHNETQPNNMRKIIAIGESVLDTVFRAGQPVRAMVGGRIACATALLGSRGLPCSMVSECCTDSVGDLVVDFLKRNHVDVRSVDRFTDGATALSAIFQDDDCATQRIVNYGRYPKERFDVVWPRIDEDDVLIFGSLYAIDLPQRERLFELVKHAVERKAIIVYLPGFQHGINFRITKVMPAILENLELAHVVIAHDRDLTDIFSGETGEEAFHNHIEYYGGNCLHIHPDLAVTRMIQEHRTHLPAAGEPTPHMLLWQAAFVAGVVEQLFASEVTYQSLPDMDDDAWRDILRNAQQLAHQCVPQNPTFNNTLTLPRQ